MKFEQKCKIIGVKDADTFLVEMHPTERIWIQETVRLDGLDASELKTEEGKQVKEQVKGKVLDKEGLLRWDRREKYGRILGTIFLEGENFNQHLLLANLVKPFDGKRRGP